MNGQQLRAILWLRWRLSQNQLVRGGSFNRVLGIIVPVLGILLSIGSGLAGLWLGLSRLGESSPWGILLGWDLVVAVFLFFWALGLITEIQRSESIDIGRLLHLPISLRQVFLLNYLASHITLVLILFLPGMMGLSLGLTLSKGPSMLLLFPLLGGFVFMISAWTYCLRGWLISLMVNQRRRRTIIVSITVGFVLVTQLPNLYFNTLSRKKPTSMAQRSEPKAVPTPEQIFLSPPSALAHGLLPPLWLPHGAAELARRNPWPAVFGTAGALLLGSLGLLRAYRGTLKFYLGNTNRKPVRPIPSGLPELQSQTTFLDKSFRGLPVEATVMALVFFRSLLRSPEAKMMLISPVVLIIIFGSFFFQKGGAAPGLRNLFLPAGSAIFILFGLLQLSLNPFGFDRNGFRALVLLPVRRRNILLAKNLSLLPVVSAFGLILLVALRIVAQLPVLQIVASAIHLAAGFFIVSMLGNFVAILVPYRMAPGSLNPTKMGFKTGILLFVFHLLFPICMTPLLIPAAVQLVFNALGGGDSLLPYLSTSLLLCAAAGAGYYFSLGPAGKFLQRREKQVLETVTHEVE